MTSILRTCYKCKIEKPLSEFPRNRTKRGGYESRCKVCARKAVREYYAEHREERLVYARKYRQGHPDKVYEVKRKWRAENPNREKSRVAEWKRDNPERVASYKHHRRAMKLENGGEFTKEEWENLCEKHGNRCLRCGKKRKLTVDHVLPISLGGSNDISNLQPLCKDCNCCKGNKHIDYRTTAIQFLSFSLFS